MKELDGYWKQFRKEYVPGETDPTTTAMLYLAFMAGNVAHHNALDRCAGMRPQDVAVMAVTSLDAEVQHYARVLAHNLKEINKAKEHLQPAPSPNPASPDTHGSMPTEPGFQEAWREIRERDFPSARDMALAVWRAAVLAPAPTASESDASAPPPQAGRTEALPNSPADGEAAPPA